MGVLTRPIIDGDEFVILLEGISGIEKAIQITEQILKDFQTPLILNDSEVVISTSIDIVLGTNKSNYK
ncbi:diguanylate cyclase domain-containing protein [Nostoc sp. 'Peltigera membranacea cyanobiont' 210A]|uniref:diguanylate cyclase domain-containing protein n=1 Tax=Nostoc sp. 'Peltigera membranacea cyanobiont' 210A TaxID=2014529 RepID=UPI00117E8860|nr:diguanylate cyclase [Nostoc sp. 'Peltigera membranacea cyanobiont' 210A]